MTTATTQNVNPVTFQPLNVPVKDVAPVSLNMDALRALTARAMAKMADPSRWITVSKE